MLLLAEVQRMNLALIWASPLYQAVLSHIHPPRPDSPVVQRTTPLCAVQLPVHAMHSRTIARIPAGSATRPLLGCTTQFGTVYPLPVTIPRSCHALALIERELPCHKQPICGAIW